MNCPHLCQAQGQSLPSSLQGSIFNAHIFPPLSFHVRTWLLLLSHYVITDSGEQHSRSIPQPPKDNTWGDSRVSAAPATFPPQCRRRRYGENHFPLVRLMKACLSPTLPHQPPRFRFAVPNVGAMEDGKCNPLHWLTSHNNVTARSISLCSELIKTSGPQLSLKLMQVKQNHKIDDISLAHINIMFMTDIVKMSLSLSKFTFRVTSSLNYIYSQKKTLLIICIWHKQHVQ